MTFWKWTISIVLAGVILWKLGIARAYNPTRVDILHNGCLERTLKDGEYSYKSLCI